jgi:mono/diheme cytochrome c family protein
MKNQLLFLVTIVFLLQSCGKTKLTFDTSVDEFILKDGFEIEVIAAEPLLDSPVAMTFDDKGRIWAVELPGYMRDIEGSEEEAPDGKIVILTDEDKDGIMDNREVFMDSMVAPRTVLHVYGGLLYSNGTSLWWSKLEDKKIAKTVLVDSLYVVGGNIEHQPNGLLYNIDNWIYSAKSKVRYRLKDGEWLRESTSFRGQWGISNDVNGRLYYNTNSIAILTDRTMPNQLLQNSYQKLQFGTQQDIATNKNLYGYQATSVNRGYQEGVLDSTGKIKTFTSACSPLVYTGDLLGGDFFQNVFVCAPEANLIKRYILEEKEGIETASPAYENSDFLVSKEETFRPVNLYNAPDGSMYILDLRKGVIQHRAYMTSHLREQILEKGLDSITGIGRIYRVIETKNKEENARDFSNLKEGELVEMLTSTLPYERNFAQQQLISRQAKSSKSAIEKVALDAKNPYGQLHALWTLEGLDAFDEILFGQLTAKKNESIIDQTLIRFSSFFNNEKEQLAYFEKVFTLNDFYINRGLAVRLGQMHAPKANELLLRLAEANRNDAVMSEAIISGIAGKETDFLTQLKPLSVSDTLTSLIKKTIFYKKTNKVQTPLLPKKTFKDNRTAGYELYSVYCSSCHGLDGAGKANLAPPLMDSEYVGESKDRLIALTLNGMQGDITVNKQVYKIQTPMPGIKNNPNLTDKDIADILTFLRNSFSLSDPWVNEKEVANWREQLKDRTQLFTEEELKDY